ncbi:CarD family transcriptional regulator [Deltaproteobacteria bacterium OttesenSCG-928-K17]|nr:CarD family transcriptional regulator [Deltaproteobacteria bacterium OttesenSCG-928-K17]
MNLEVGALAFYPAHGVGQIEAKEKRIVGDQSFDVLVMRILENNMKIMIPAQNIDDVGLRPLMGKKEVDKIYQIFKKPAKIPDTTNWNRRHREYMEKIKTGSPFEVASVMCELLSMRVEKDLSFGERKLLDTVRVLLVKEVALASKKSEKLVEEEIFAFFPPPKGAQIKGNL